MLFAEVTKPTLMGPTQVATNAARPMDLDAAAGIIGGDPHMLLQTTFSGSPC